MLGKLLFSNGLLCLRYTFKLIRGFGNCFKMNFKKRFVDMFWFYFFTPLQIESSVATKIKG